MEGRTTASMAPQVEKLGVKNIGLLSWYSASRRVSRGKQSNIFYPHFYHPSGRPRPGCACEPPT